MSKKRRAYTAQFKFETIVEVLRGEKSNAQICRERNVTESLLYRWKQDFLDRAPGIFEDQRSRDQVAEEREQRIVELERMVGRLTMEIEVLKKARSILGSEWQTNGR